MQKTIHGLTVGAALTLVLGLVAASPAKPTVTLTLVPQAGPPGTLVTIEGYMPSAIHRRDHNYGPITFGSAADGLSLIPNSVTWSKSRPGHFITHFRVPTVPWLSSTGEVALQPGSYAVGIQCFGASVAGCTTQATATFRLTGPIRRPKPKPTLSISPKAAAPGTMLTVSGWAPLTSESAAIPNGYELVWHSTKSAAEYASLGQVEQHANGDLYGTVQVPVSGPNDRLQGPGYLSLQSYAPVTKIPRFDSLPFNVLTPRSLAQALRGQSVVSLISNQSRGRQFPLATRGAWAYTAVGRQLWESSNNGQSWTPMARAPLAHTVATEGYKLFWQVDLVGLTLAPASHNQLFASIPTENPKLGAPPIIDLGVFTENGGKTWQFAPPPIGMGLQDFGGFQSHGRAIWAWWQTPSGQIRVEATLDGGRHWHMVSPSAAGVAHHLFLGPIPADSYGAMGASESEPLVAARGGHWRTSGLIGLDEGPLNQLATLSNGTTLWLGNPQYPVQATTNRGKTWQYLGTPSSPGSSLTSSPLERMLPNGALLAFNPQRQAYYVLPPGRTRWTRVPVAYAPNKFSVLGVSNHMVYWMATDAYNLGRPSAIIRVPVSDY